MGIRRCTRGRKHFRILDVKYTGYTTSPYPYHPLPKHSLLILCICSIHFVLSVPCRAGGQQTYIPDRYKGIVLNAPEPDMPSVRFSRNSQSGRGVYRLVIDALGSVDEVKVRKYIGVPRADAAAIKRLLDWKFRPGVLKYIDVPVMYQHDFQAELKQARSETMAGKAL
jgi:TonB family protein